MTSPKNVAGVVGIATFALFATIAPSFAQQPPQPAVPPPPVQGTETTPPDATAQGIPTDPGKGQSVLQFVTTTGRTTDTIILADRSVAREMVSPAKVKNGENIERTLTQLTRMLPKGTIWAKIYLPSKGSAASAFRWNPDTVADFILLQSQLFGNVGAATPEGTIEIMGKRVSGNDATTITSALNLRPVYILINPLRRDMLMQAPMPNEARQEAQAPPVEAPDNPNNPSIPPQR